MGMADALGLESGVVRLADYDDRWPLLFAEEERRIRGEVGTLAVELAGKVVGESLDDDARARATVDRFIADLEAQAAAEPGGQVG